MNDYLKLKTIKLWIDFHKQKKEKWYRQNVMVSKSKQTKFMSRNLDKVYGKILFINDLEKFIRKVERDEV